MSRLPLLKVSVADGKYTVIQDAGGRLYALRHGQPWRDCVGDNLILSLAQRVAELEEDIAALHAVDKEAQ